ncbi:antigen 5 like allergen Cul n 1-like [Uranotaenia lowii]|uniref:antigen 5 like allergen Cul n 1-like n=1 Tax=Uranotaenia lowii TaxID=190385 RepID=UPI002479B216|nr:antigen 5 like allergen Cul n 1-like [Uranotaenia lowii]
MKRPEGTSQGFVPRVSLPASSQQPAASSRCVGGSLIWLAASLKLVLTVVDYCDKKICADHQPNNGCNNERMLLSKWPAGSKIVEVTDELKKLILDTHNKYRSILHADTWDDDLEDTAQMNAYQCVKAHDPCHNTDKYLNSGQNINKVSTTEEINI